jgi:hypothetical protein
MVVYYHNNIPGLCVMSLFTDGRVPRECEVCQRRYRPRSPDQRFCGFDCRMKGKAAEGRAARRLWVQAGRPREAELEQQQ